MGTLIRRAALSGAVLLVLLAACTDSTGPDPQQVRLLVAPSFAPAPTSADGENPAHLVDNVRVVLVAVEGDTAVDLTVDWPAGQDTLQIEVTVQVTGSASFDLEVQGRIGTTVAFRAGPLRLELTGGASAPPAVEPVMEYTGPEGDVAAVTITGAPEVFMAGDTVVLGATGTLSDGTELPDPLMRWTSLDPEAATVTEDGVVHVKHDLARTVSIEGRVAFTDVAATVDGSIDPFSMSILAASTELIGIGDEALISANILGVDGGSVINADVHWTATSPAVELSDDAGMEVRVRAVEPGEAWVIAVAGALADSVLVTVRQAVISSYTVTDIGHLGGGWSWATGINGLGDVVGESATSDETYSAFLWSAGQLTALPTPSGFEDAWAAGLNDSRVVVGCAWGYDEEMGWSGERPVRWADSEPSLLPLPADAMEGCAGGINGHDVMVGWSWFWEDEYEDAVHALQWSGTEVSILTPLDGGEAVAWGINDAGEIVGSSLMSDGGVRAVRWVGDTPTGLPPVSGYTDSWGTAIASNGLVAGSSWSEETGDRATLWDGTTATGLGTVREESWAWATGVNAFAQVVGEIEYYEDETWHWLPFIWQGGTMSDLNDLIETADWEILWPTGINDAGQIAAEAWHDGSGAYLAVRLDPTPEGLFAVVPQGPARVPDRPARERRPGLGERPSSVLMEGDGPRRPSSRLLRRR